MDKIFIDEALNELETIKDLFRWTVSRFNAADLYYKEGESVWDEAKKLLLTTLCLPLHCPAELYLARLTYSERHRIVKRVVRRVNERLPIPYLINKTWFAGLEFYLDQRVPIPYSAIGKLMQTHFSGVLHTSPSTILDLCTGCGCMAIACAHYFPDAEVDAVDISAEALQVTEQNIAEHGVDQQVHPMRSDLFRSLSAKQYDLILSHPPDLVVDRIADLPQEYRYEPEVGMAAGSDGLKFIRRILASASDFLHPEGVLICEVGNCVEILQQEYPELPFHWIGDEGKNKGIFVLTQQQLLSYKELFKLYRD